MNIHETVIYTGGKRELMSSADTYGRAALKHSVSKYTEVNNDPNTICNLISYHLCLLGSPPEKHNFVLCGGHRSTIQYSLWLSVYDIVQQRH